MILYYSFAHKVGIPENCDLYFDVRDLPNPTAVECDKVDYEQLTGKDARISDAVRHITMLTHTTTATRAAAATATGMHRRKARKKKREVEEKRGKEEEESRPTRQQPLLFSRPKTWRRPFARYLPHRCVTICGVSFICSRMECGRRRRKSRRTFPFLLLLIFLFLLFFFFFFFFFSFCSSSPYEYHSLHPQ